MISKQMMDKIEHQSAFTSEALWDALDSGIVPVVPNLHQKMLQAIEDGGTLDMTAWHGMRLGADYVAWCGSTHCRAGWAVHLAGAEGYLLEEQFDTETAGLLITAASCPWLEETPELYVCPSLAMVQIENCAEREKQYAASLQETCELQEV